MMTISRAKYIEILQLQRERLEQEYNNSRVNLDMLKDAISDVNDLDFSEVEVIDNENGMSFKPIEEKTA